MSNQSQKVGALLAVLAGAPFLASLDLFVVNVAFEDIGRAFEGNTLGQLSWILNGYAIVYAALLIPLGRWGDRIGRKRGFVAGLVLFTAASAAAVIAPNLVLLVVFRLLQAVGAAALTPTSLGLLIDAVPPEKRAAAVRIWTALGAVAAALGPVVGGVLVELSWRWVFIVNIPIGIALLVVAIKIVPDAVPARASGRSDLLGATLLTVGIGALALAVVQGPEWGWGSIGIVVAFVVALIAVAAFWRTNTMIDPALLRVKPFLWANVAGFFFSAAFAAGLLANIFWLQQVWGYSALIAGLAIAPGPAVVPAFAMLGQRASKSVGAGTIAAAGCLLLGLGSILILVSVGIDPAYATTFLPGWLVAGAGVGLALPTIMSTATAELPPVNASTGSAVVTMSRQIGTVGGISILVAVLASHSGESGFHIAWWTIAAIAAVAAVSAIGMTARTRVSEHSQLV